MTVRLPRPIRRLVLAAVLAVAAAPAAPAEPGKPGRQAHLAPAELGERVLAITRALRDPGAPGAMRAVVALGHDQRYHVMVRGWLGYRLQADRSVRDAHRGSAPAALEERIEFLERAIRLIDLE